MSVWSVKKKEERQKDSTHTHTHTHTLNYPQCGTTRERIGLLTMRNYQASNEVELRREDSDGYCSRRNEQVLVLGGTCFCKNRDWACAGCVLDSEWTRIPVKLIWLMSEILQDSDLEKKADVQ